MSIDVYGFLEVSMTEKLLHDPYIYSLFGPSGGECVTQAMRVKSFDSCLITNSIERAAHIDWVERSAYGCFFGVRE